MLHKLHEEAFRKAEIGRQKKKVSKHMPAQTHTNTNTDPSVTRSGEAGVIGEGLGWRSRLGTKKGRERHQVKQWSL